MMQNINHVSLNDRHESLKCCEMHLSFMFCHQVWHAVSEASLWELRKKMAITGFSKKRKKTWHLPCGNLVWLMIETHQNTNFYHSMCFFFSHRFLDFSTVVPWLCQQKPYGVLQPVPRQDHGRSLEAWLGWRRFRFLRGRWDHPFPSFSIERGEVMWDNVWLV